MLDLLAELETVFIVELNSVLMLLDDSTNNELFTGRTPPRWLLAVVDFIDDELATSLLLDSTDDSLLEAFIDEALLDALLELFTELLIELDLTLELEAFFDEALLDDLIIELFLMLEIDFLLDELFLLLLEILLELDFLLDEPLILELLLILLEDLTLLLIELLLDAVAIGVSTTFASFVIFFPFTVTVVTPVSLIFTVITSGLSLYPFGALISLIIYVPVRRPLKLKYPV